MPRGRPRNLKLHDEVVRLRRLGFTFPQIAKQLNCTKQNAHHVFKMLRVDVEQMAELRCQGCEALIVSGNPQMWNRNPAWCLRCLAKIPDAPFSIRLRAFRLAKGLSAAQLAKEAGVTVSAVRYHEWCLSNPRWDFLVKVVRVLGPELVWFAAEPPFRL
jgi:hypothetical protein